MLIFILGLLTGIIGGMGIGGGTILIPGLSFITDYNQQTLQGINLLSFIPVAIIALIIHIKNKNILFKLSIPIITFGLIGAWIGSKLTSQISSNLLNKSYGIFLIFMGIHEIFYKSKKSSDK